MLSCVGAFLNSGDPKGVGIIFLGSIKLGVENTMHK